MSVKQGLRSWAVSAQMLSTSKSGVPLTTFSLPFWSPWTSPSPSNTKLPPPTESGPDQGLRLKLLQHRDDVLGSQSVHSEQWIPKVPLGSLSYR